MLSKALDERWIALARLQRGAQVLPAESRSLDESQPDAAIQVAEDWLMPYASDLRGAMPEATDRSRLVFVLDFIGSITSYWSILITRLQHFV